MLKHIIKKGYVDSNKIILDNHIKLNLSAEEIFVIINLIELYKTNQSNLSVSSLAKKMNITTDICSSALNGLLNKGYITLNIEYTKSGKAKEVFSIDEFVLVLEKMFLEDIKQDKIVKSENLIKDVIELTEKSFNKTLTPYEIDIVLAWIESNETINSIKKGIDIAISKNITNLRYVDKIILASKNQSEENNEKESKALDDIFRNLK